jgi:hypothetical protein
LVAKLKNFTLNDEKEQSLWKWTSSRKFTVKSVYEHLTKDGRGESNKRIRKAKIPEKIKIFMWLAEQKAILTKDNLIRRKWKGSPGCYFCGNPETTDNIMFSCPTAKVVWGVVALCFHQRNRPICYEQFWVWIVNALPGGQKVYMLGLAAVCWTIWKTRNRACFKKKNIKNLGEILYYTCALMRYQAGLYLEETQKMINSVVELVMKTVLRLLGKQGGGNATPMLLGNEADKEEREEEAQPEPDKG